MITFLLCLGLLVAAYFTYSKYIVRMFNVDPTRPIPARTRYDGADYVPMSSWRTFLIQFLNIAGLGPIFLHLEQRSMRKRLYICVPLFATTFVITMLNFDIIWRYFAWANQTLAAISLWAVTLYLASRGRNYWVVLFPVVFMTMTVSTYLFVSEQMAGMPYGPGLVVAGLLTLLILGFYLWRIRLGCKPQIR